MTFCGKPESACWFGKRAVLYIRVSTDEQARHGYSLAAQRDALDDFAQQYKMQVVGVFADEGISARQQIRKRPALLALLDAVRAGATDYVLFIKLDRWFRSVSDYYKAQDVLDAAGVGWKAVLEDYDTTTTNGRLNLNVRLAVAQDESDRTSDRIKFVFAQRVRDGGCITGSVPFGYQIQDHRMVVDETKRQIVAGAFDCFEARDSSHACLDYLRAQGVDLSFSSVRRLLRNPLYCGQFHGIDHYCDAIISVEQWERIQTRLAQRAAVHVRDRRYDYIFSGLLRCPVCGSVLVGSPQNHAGTQPYLRYRCPRHFLSRSCPCGACPWEKRIEDWLLDHITPQLDDYLIRWDIQQAQQRTARVDVGSIRARISRLQDLYVDGLIDAGPYRAKYDALQKQLAAAEQHNATFAPARDLAPLRALLAGDFRAIYGTLTAPERRALWASVIDSIVVVDGSARSLDLQVNFLP